MKNLLLTLSAVVSFLAIAQNAFAGNAIPQAPEPISTTLFLVGGAALVAVKKLRNR